MPKSKEYISDSESGSDVEPKQKKKKTEPKEKSKKESKGASSKAKGSDDGEESKIPLGKNRFASVREFRGMIMIDIREFYDADGEMKPGKKGIALSVDQWNKLKAATSKIDEAIAAMD